MAGLLGRMAALSVAHEVRFDAAEAGLIHLTVFDALIVNTNDLVHAFGTLLVVFEDLAAALLLVQSALIVTRF